jgi:hypothetical protein
LKKYSWILFLPPWVRLLSSCIWPRKMLNWDFETWILS